MLLFPESICQGTCNTLQHCFERDPTKQINPVEQARNLQNQRKKFYDQCLQTPIFQHEIDYTNWRATHLTYLNTTYDIMELLDQKAEASTPWRPSYFSGLSVVHPTFQVKHGSNELSSTIEILMSRYSYALGSLKGIKRTFLGIEGYCKPGQFEGLSNSIKRVIDCLEDVSAKFGKLFYARDLIWTPLAQEKDLYSTIPELNYYLIEGFYL